MIYCPCAKMLKFQYQKRKQRQLKQLQGIKLLLNCGFDFVLVELQNKMKPACCTDPNQPAQSFIKSVCYPESYKFTSKATTWGCNHEKFACDMFLDVHKGSHENVTYMTQVSS